MGLQGVVVDRIPNMNMDTGPFMHS
jgi:hypothetical protein